jgi:hypothetical protein
MFAMGMVLKAISIKTVVFLHQGTTSRNSHSKTIEMSFTQEFISGSNISSTSWLTALDEASRKKVSQRRCIVAILWSSSISLRTEAGLSISIIIASAGAVSLKPLNISSPVDTHYVRLALRPMDATKPERVFVFMNVPSNHIQDVNLDRYTSCLRRQGFACLCWMSISALLSQSKNC